MKHLLIQGNPVDGFQYIGPFSNRDEAIEAGEELKTGDWWIAEIIDWATFLAASIAS